MQSCRRSHGALLGVSALQIVFPASDVAPYDGLFSLSTEEVIEGQGVLHSLPYQRPLLPQPSHAISKTTVKCRESLSWGG